MKANKALLALALLLPALAWAQPDAGPDQGPVCLATSLEANQPPAGISGSWSVILGQGVFPDPGSPTTLVEQVGPGDNVYRWSWDDGQWDEVSVAGMGISLPQDVVTCETAATVEATLVNATGGAFSFSTSGGHNALGVGPEVTLFLMPAESTVLTAVWSEAGCSLSDSASVRSEAVSVSIDYMGAVCEPSATLTDLHSLSYGNATGSWAVLSGSATITQHSAETYLYQAANLSLGTNQLRYTIANAFCTATEDIFLHHQLADAGPDLASFNDSVVLGATAPMADFFGFWSHQNPFLQIGSVYSHDANARSSIFQTAELVWTLQGSECQTFDTMYVSFIEALDFGDLPDSYELDPQLSAANPARHSLSGLFLGTAPDPEALNQPTALADGDDNNGTADEDGASAPPQWVSDGSSQILLDFEASVPGCLSGWVDWNKDGSFQVGELAIAPTLLMAGSNSVALAVPLGALGQQGFQEFPSRFRVYPDNTGGGCPNENARAYGRLEGGEVEDYVLQAFVEVSTTWSGSGWTNGPPPANGTAAFAGNFDVVAPWFCGEAMVQQGRVTVCVDGSMFITGVPSMGKALLRLSRAR